MSRIDQSCRHEARIETRVAQLLNPLASSLKFGGIGNISSIALVLGLHTAHCTLQNANQPIAWPVVCVCVFVVVVQNAHS